MTNQEIFDKVWNHFIVNKQKYSYMKHFGPALKDETGNKCVIGLFVDDEKYTPYLEGSELSQLVKRKLVNFEAKNSEFVLALQCFHDLGAIGAEFKNEIFDMKPGMLHVAKEHDLTIPEVEPKVEQK